MKLVRIQDKFGRGPWRPGFSRQWLSEDGPPLPPAIQETVPNFPALVARAHEKGLHIGCACREADMGKWVQPSEMRRLVDHGFRLVNATQCKILAEDENQVLIASRKPFRALPRVKT